MYQPKEIIDFHVHCFPEKIAKSAIGKLAETSGFEPLTDGTITDTIKKLKEWNIKRAVLLNIATKSGQESSINRFIATLDNYTEKKDDFPQIVPFGSVHPNSENIDEILENYKKNNIKGIKLHPDYQGFNANDKAFYPIYKKCQELNLIVLLHTGYDPVSPEHMFATPDMLLKIIDDFKDLKFVFAHLGGTYRWEEVIEKIVGADVYLDMAICGKLISKDVCKTIIQKHGSKRILFGSDLPWYSPKEATDFLLSLDLSEKELDNIFYKNAINLLKL